MCVRMMVAMGACMSLVGAAPPAEPTPVLHLINNGQVAGKLLASDDPAVARWQSPAFAKPLEFPMSAVTAVQYAVPMTPPNPRDEYGFELVDGDFLFGNLLALTDDAVELESTRFGRVRVQRDQIRRLFRWKGADTVYLGPNGLSGWKDSAAPSQWREEGGQLATDQKGASIFSDIGLPDKAMIEAEISWKVKPNFELALGVDANEASLKYAFRFEVWNGDLVAIGESQRDADVAIVESAGPLGGIARIRAYLDQPQRRLILVSPTGKTLATLNIAGTKAQSRSGVRLTNGEGDVRLEHLRVTRWDGSPPSDARDEQAYVRRTNGSIVYGRLAAFDATTKRFTIREGEKDTVVPSEEVLDSYLKPERPEGKDAADAPRTMRIDCRDGSRVSGVPTRIEEGHVTLTCPGVKEPVRVPLADVRSLIPVRHGVSAAAGPPAEGRLGRLEMDGLSLKGRFTDAGGRADVGVLIWQAELALNASDLFPGLSGRVVYRDPPPPPPPTPSTQPGPAGGIMAAPLIGVLFGGNNHPPVNAKSPQGSDQRSMHLRSGDTIPCDVTRIDEKGVTFKSPNSDTTFVAHERIKSVELIPTRDAPDLDEIKRDRLLTLPRMQRDSPPTHLICAKSGDFLRGRIVAMDDDVLKVEVRLEIKEVPRDRVAQIIWLHADELVDAKKPAVPTPPSRETRAQTINSAGNRMTFVVQKADGKMISGSSDVLGACRSDLSDVDQVLFGGYIEQSAAKLAYHVWKLHNAPDPKFVSADAAGSGDGGPTGTESALVGQPAPAFQLEALDGSNFKLSERKGHVVVLDFWATWCGPCMQSMPLVEGVIGEFADRQVELLAVNMEEQPDKVKSMLERHKFKVPVAIDRDGAVAAKYAVTAIPQTVVIDRDGKVARLFVGGGKGMADALRQVLQELTAAPKP